MASPKPTEVVEEPVVAIVEVEMVLSDPEFDSEGREIRRWIPKEGS